MRERQESVLRERKTTEINKTKSDRREREKESCPLLTFSWGSSPDPRERSRERVEKGRKRARPRLVTAAAPFFSFRFFFSWRGPVSSHSVLVVLLCPGAGVRESAPVLALKGGEEIESRENAAERRRERARVERARETRSSRSRSRSSFFFPSSPRSPRLTTKKKNSFLPRRESLPSALAAAFLLSSFPPFFPPHQRRPTWTRTR